MIVKFVKITPNDTGALAGKLADAELHFTDGPLAGFKLIGFAVWDWEFSDGRRHVTFPARQYSVNGERRSVALLRPLNTDAQDYNFVVHDFILSAYTEFEAG